MVYNGCNLRVIRKVGASLVGGGGGGEVEASDGGGGGGGEWELILMVGVGV